MSDFLDYRPQIIQPLLQDLQLFLKKPATFLTSITPAQLLRSLILMLVKNFYYL